MESWPGSQEAIVTSTPRVQYAQSEGVNIAYRALDGDGPDIVYVSGWVSHVDMMWEDPDHRRFFDRLDGIGRLITFDKRGVGLSDRVSEDRLPTLEERMDDVRAVLEAVGSDSAYIFGHSEGSVMSTLYAATYPERTLGLILYGGYAARTRSDSYPWAPTADSRQQIQNSILTDWPYSTGWQAMAPSRASDEEFIESWGRYLQSAASPAAAHALHVMNSRADIRDLLPSVTTPTLIIHRRDDQIARIEGARYMAEHMPNARLVELEGSDHLPWLGNSEEVLVEVEEFVAGTRTAQPVDRVLATILFTDIVDSTRHAASVGDAQWRRLLDKHDEISRSEIARFRGRPVKGTGDGYLATFDGPARAIRAATAIKERVAGISIEVRAGIHAGEIELRDDDIGGIGVHIAARVAAEALPNEVLVSRTVRDLVAGSGIVFAERGNHTLKGVADTWELYAVVGGAG